MAKYINRYDTVSAYTAEASARDSLGRTVSLVTADGKLHYDGKLNPLGLPANTVRAKFKSGYTPSTIGTSRICINSSENIWDITDDSGNWTAMFWDDRDDEDKVLDVLGINISSDYVPGTEYQIKSIVNHEGKRYILLYGDHGSYPNVKITDTDWVPEHWTPLSINDWCVLTEYTAANSIHRVSENSFRFVFYGTTADPSNLGVGVSWNKAATGTFCSIWDYSVGNNADQTEAFKNTLTSDIGTCLITNFPKANYVNSYAEMFYGCTAIKGILDNENFNIERIDAHSMFENCTNLERICNCNIVMAGSSPNYLNVKALFKGCSRLTDIDGGSQVQIPDIGFDKNPYRYDNYDELFMNCPNVVNGINAEHDNWPFVIKNIWTEIYYRSLEPVADFHNAFTNCGTGTAYGMQQRQTISSTFGGDGPSYNPEG